MLRPTGTHTGREGSRSGLRTFVLAAFLILLAIGWLIYLCVVKTNANDEIQMALVIVGGIATLMTILFVLAAGFSAMKLADNKQALGLPEGSIRAMIALVLIMIFIIFGIYLFRMIGTGSYSYIGNMPTIPPPTIANQFTKSERRNDNTYDVWIATTMSEDGKRVAQQLITTVGTLVVAVAGFYFGSTAVSGAVTAVKGGAAETNPKITDVSPREGTKGQQIDVEITGTDFRSPKAVSLVRGNETMIGMDILSNREKIRCKLTLDKDPDGQWDVVVENDDGKQALLPKAFTIKGT
jgi:hypothetical protein